jgi:hypothetical protein
MLSAQGDGDVCVMNRVVGMGAADGVGGRLRLFARAAAVTRFMLAWQKKAAAERAATIFRPSAPLPNQLPSSTSATGSRDRERVGAHHTCLDLGTLPRFGDTPEIAAEGWSRRQSSPERDGSVTLVRIAIW